MEGGGTLSGLGRDIMELSGGEWNETGTNYCTKNFLYIHDDPMDMRIVRTKNCDESLSEYTLYTSFALSHKLTIEIVVSTRIWVIKSAIV